MLMSGFVFWTKLPAILYVESIGSGMPDITSSKSLVGFKMLTNLVSCAFNISIILPFLKTAPRSEEHTSELQSRGHLVCRLLLEKKKVYEQITHDGYTDCVLKTDTILRILRHSTDT